MLYATTRIVFVPPAEATPGIKHAASKTMQPRKARIVIVFIIRLLLGLTSATNEEGTVSLDDEDRKTLLPS